MKQYLYFFIFLLFLYNERIFGNRDIDANKRNKYSKALEYFNQGLLLQNHSKFEESLPFTRAAVRLCSHCLRHDCLQCVPFIIELARLEKSLGFHSKVLRRLELLQHVDPSAASTYFTEFKEEIDELLNEDLNTKCDNNNNNNAELIVSEIPVYDFNEIFASCGINCYEIKTDVVDNSINSQPFIIRNALNYMKWNLSYLDILSNKYYSNYKVDLYPQNLKLKPIKVYNVDFKEAIDFLQFPEGAYVNIDITEPGTYIQMNINKSFLNDLIVNGNINFSEKLIFSLKHFMVNFLNITDIDKYNNIIDIIALKLHWNMILIGESNAGMFLHQDIVPVASWQGQIIGSKMWLICNPDSINNNNFDYYNNYENIDTVVKSYTDESFDYNNSYIYPPDSKKNDDNNNQLMTDCFSGIVNKGDILFYPPNFWHKTITTKSPSLAVSSSIIINNKYFYDFLIEECFNNNNTNFNLDDNFCILLSSTRE